MPNNLIVLVQRDHLSVVHRTFEIMKKACLMHTGQGGVGLGMHHAKCIHDGERGIEQNLFPVPQGVVS